jgi:hypothetical protein
MASAGKTYVVRSVEAADRAEQPDEVTYVYAYTLHGLITALEDARFRSHGGTPQELVLLADGQSKVLRRFESGHEVPLTP